MRIYICSIVLLSLIGCVTTADKKTTSTTNNAALKLAQIVTEHEDPGADLKADLHQRIDFEDQYWQEQLSKVLSGEDLEKALEHLDDSQNQLEDSTESLTSRDELNARMANFLSTVFTDDELTKLVAMLSAPEWEKYQLVMRQISLAPDILGVRADFNEVLEKQRDKLGQNIFGEQSFEDEPVASH